MNLDLLHRHDGFSLVVVLFVVILLSTIGLAMSSLLVSSRTEATMELDVDRAAYIARAGFERTCADILMSADQWDTLSTTPFNDEPFADGSYTVTLGGLTADGAIVNVAATYRGRSHELVFDCVRETGGAGMQFIPEPAAMSLTPGVGAYTTTPDVFSVDGSSVEYTTNTMFTYCWQPGSPWESTESFHRAWDWQDYLALSPDSYPGACGSEGTSWDHDTDTFLMCEDTDDGYKAWSVHYTMAPVAEARGFAYGECPDELGNDKAKMTICHDPDDGGGTTMSIATNAWPGHSNHGDHPGPCQDDGEEPEWNPGDGTIRMCKNPGTEAQHEVFVEVSQADDAEAAGWAYGRCPELEDDEAVDPEAEPEAVAPTVGVIVVDVTDVTLTVLSR